MKFSGLRNQCDRLVEDPTVEPGTLNQWQPASSFPNSAWTSPGKPVKDLIKYDSHKKADIASFLRGDNNGGGGGMAWRQWGVDRKTAAINSIP